MQRYSTLFIKILMVEALMIRLEKLSIRKLFPHLFSSKEKLRKREDRFVYQNHRDELELHPSQKFEISTDETGDGYLVHYGLTNDL